MELGSCVSLLATSALFANFLLHTLPNSTRLSTSHRVLGNEATELKRYAVGKAQQGNT